MTLKTRKHKTSAYLPSPKQTRRFANFNPNQTRKAQPDLQLCLSVRPTALYAMQKSFKFDIFLAIVSD